MDFPKFLASLRLSSEDVIDTANKLEAEAVTFTQLLTTIDRTDLEDIGIKSDVCSKIITLRQVIRPCTQLTTITNIKYYFISSIRTDA